MAEYGIDWKSPVSGSKTSWKSIWIKMSMLLALLGIWLMIGLPASAKEAVQWESNIDVAFEKAKAANLPVFLHFYGEHCPPCRMMEKDVFSRDDVADTLHRNFIPVKINTAVSPALVKKFAITGIPADIVMTPGGRVLFRQVGGQKADAFQLRLSQVAAYYKNRLSSVENAVSAPPAVAVQPERAYAQSKTASPNRPPTSSSQMGTAGSSENREANAPAMSRMRATAGGSPSLGGNSPRVRDPALSASNSRVPAGRVGSEQRADLRGSDISSRQKLNQIESELQKLRSSSGKHGTFANSEGTPAPRMASNRGSVPYAGHAARETDRSATNRDAVGRERSAAKPPHAAEQAALALDGYCPILLTDEERWVPGSLRWSLVHQGLRYCFSSPEARQRFLNQPRRYSLVLAGKDIVLMVQEGKQVAGKREFGVWYEGLIFLFSSQETFDRFHENPQYFAKIASRINAPLSQNPPVHRR